MPKHYTAPPTMETQTTGREKRAYLDNADELKKKTPRDAPRTTNRAAMRLKNNVARAHQGRCNAEERKGSRRRRELRC